MRVDYLYCQDIQTHTPFLILFHHIMNIFNIYSRYIDIDIDIVHIQSSSPAAPSGSRGLQRRVRQLLRELEEIHATSQAHRNPKAQQPLVVSDVLRKFEAKAERYNWSSHSKKYMQRKHRKIRLVPKSWRITFATPPCDLMQSLR